MDSKNPNPPSSSSKRTRINSDENNEININEKFFVIKTINENRKLSQINSIAINASITAIIGKQFKASRMRSGDLLIEVERAAQAVQLYQLTDLKFNGQSLPIKVEPHRSLNSCKGVARNFEFKIFESDEEIADCLAPQGVTHCKRIIIKRDGQKITTGTAILTFNKTTLPPSIKLGFVSVRLTDYIPPPLRCFRCQKFGHTNTTCKRRIVCAKCSEEHEDKICQARQNKCANCGGGHTVFSKECPILNKEKEVINIKITKKCTFREAKAMVEARCPQGTSYATIVSSSQKIKVINANTNTKTVTRSIGIQTMSDTELVKEMSTQTADHSADLELTSRPLRASPPEQQRADVSPESSLEASQEHPPETSPDGHPKDSIPGESEESPMEILRTKLSRPRVTSNSSTDTQMEEEDPPSDSDAFKHPGKWKKAKKKKTKNGARSPIKPPKNAY
jgi:hypothetical protein